MTPDFLSSPMRVRAQPDAHVYFTALDLADEYGIRHWIKALLDPEPIIHGTSDPKKTIKSPPPFHMTETTNGAKTPGGGRRTTRGARSMRSESPSKAKATPRKIATPRRPRRTRGTTAEPEEPVVVAPVEPVNGTTASPKTTVNGTTAPPKDTVRLEVETTTGANGEEDVKLKVEMPSNHPNLDIPDNTDEMLEKARQMVAEARKIDGTITREKGKRKIEEVVEKEDEIEAEAASRAAARARPVEVELRKEKIRRRALTGIAATLAVRYVSDITHSPDMFHGDC